MTNATIIYTIIACTLVGIILGYISGYYTRTLSDTVKRLETERDAPKEPEVAPTITMGTYTSPNPYITYTATGGVGIAIPKSPQLVEFETEQAIEKRALS